MNDRFVLRIPRPPRGLATSFILVFFFYLWVASLTYSCRLCGQVREYYNLQVNGFLDGRLDLPIHFDANYIQTAKDQNKLIAYFKKQLIYDLSFYKGKLYSYFGVTPALTLYLPYRLLSMGRSLPDKAAVFFFGFGSFVWSALLLEYLKKRYFPGTPEWMAAFSCRILGFANMVPLLIREYLVYDVPIASGLFFLTGALYFVCTAFAGQTVSRRRLGLGSLFLGLAAGSRPNLLLAGLAVALLVFWKAERSRPRQGGTAKWVLSVWGPFLICLALLGVYNYLRFDNPFELGILKYQLRGGLSPSAPIDQSRFFASILVWLARFNGFYPEIPDSRTVGLLWIAPFILLIPLALALGAFGRKKNGDSEKPQTGTFPAFEFLAVTSSGILTLCLSCFYFAVLMRYYADFMTLLLLAGCLLWFHTDAGLDRTPKARWLLRILAVSLGVASLLATIAYCFNFIDWWT